MGEVKPLGPVNYSAAADPPENYRCNGCGAHGVRLYREYQTFLDHQTLLCTQCTLKDQKLTVADPYVDITKARAIGWRVPAVPTQDGETYWGYTSCPEEGVQWWRSLPIHSPAQLEEMKERALKMAGREPDPKN